MKVEGTPGVEALGKSKTCFKTAMAWLCAAFLLALPGAQAIEYGFAPVSGQMTSKFGWRTDPIRGNTRFHGGIDIAAPMGMAVYAPQDGMVVYSGAYGGYGNVVVLNHGNSLFTLYGHNSKLLVQAGQMIQRGQLISQVGSTGRSTGPHLHFEVHYNRQYVDPVLYLGYLQQQNPTLARHSKPAYHQPAVTHVAAKTDTLSQAPRQTIRRHRRTGRTGRTVQLVNGDEIENIKF